MNKEYEIFINLISSYINNIYKKDINAIPINWVEIYKLAKLHGLGGLLYLSLTNSKLCDDAVIMDKFKQMFLILATKSMVQEATTLKLIDILNKNQIRHILFKGFVLKDYYPDKEVRTMGDIDIVIDEVNQQKVHDILISNGFVFDEFASHKDVRNYNKNNVCFEIHTSVVEENFLVGVDFIEYYKDCFGKASLINSFTYEFKPENHLIYLIVHMAKHFRDSGCGVRMVLDIALIIKKQCDSLNWDYLKAELEKLKLLRFAKTIFSLCLVWFGINSPFSVSDLDLSSVESYIMQGGIFGYENKNYDAIRLNRNNENLIKRIVNLIGYIFPGYEHLKRRYVWMENIPKYLLPIAWIKYWWFRGIENKENVFGRIKNAIVSNDDAAFHNEMMKTVGLDV